MLCNCLNLSVDYGEVKYASFFFTSPRNFAIIFNNS